MPYFWQLAINPKLKTQNSIISFGYVDSYAKIFLILYPPFENSTTRIAIVILSGGFPVKQAQSPRPIERRLTFNHHSAYFSWQGRVESSEYFCRFNQNISSLPFNVVCKNIIDKDTFYNTKISLFCFTCSYKT